MAVLSGELLRYALAGGLTTLLNAVVFWGLSQGVGLHYMAANTAAWLAAVAFSYLVNRLYVFRSKGDWRGECCRFLVSRVLTLLMENGLLFVMIAGLSIPEAGAKVTACLASIAVNYVLCRGGIFSGRSK